MRILILLLVILSACSKENDPCVERKFHSESSIHQAVNVCRDPIEFKLQITLPRIDSIGDIYNVRNCDYNQFESFHLDYRYRRINRSGFEFTFTNSEDYECALEVFSFDFTECSRI